MIEIIKKEFKAHILEEKHQRNEIYLTIKKEECNRICEFLYHQLKYPLVCIFATDERKDTKCFGIYYVFSSMKDDVFIIIKINIDEKTPKFNSLTQDIASANWYEREIKDMFGLYPIGHPDSRQLIHFEDWDLNLYPLRKDFDIKTKSPRINGKYEYRRVEGEGVYEIPVGPVHAGVIEPGHFRFSVAGEPVIALEIRHFYTHKGVEKLFENMSLDNSVFLAERISGDNSVSHVVAYCNAIEKIADLKIPMRAKYIRVILLELERLYNHLGDIAGIATDVAYTFGASHFNRLKEKIMQLNEVVSGSRFLRGMNTIGGVRRDIEDKKEIILSELLFIELEFKELIEHLMERPSVLDRIETTGKIYNETAVSLHVVGPVGRASGIEGDVRLNHPYEAYNNFNFKVPVYKNGDVYARTKVRAEEIIESIGIIRQALYELPKGDIKTEVKEISGYGLGVSESPRGELIYWVKISKNKIERCKVRDPSFCNWLAIEYAVLDNIVPDFPIINKSLSLSYSGNDM